MGRLLTFSPAPFSRTKSLFRVSWPGTGLAITGPAAGQDFGRGQAARFGKHDIGRRHQLIDFA